MWTEVLRRRSSGPAGSLSRSEIEPATRSMPSSRAVARAHVIAGAVERLGAGEQRLAAPQRAPLLGQDDELRAVGGGRAGEPIGALEVRVEVCGGGQLDGGDAHGVSLLPD